MSVTPFLQFFYGFAAYSSYLSCVAQALQAFHRCGNNVLRVVGTQALGTDVLDAGSLNYCTNSAAGDNAGTGSSRLEQNAACTELADNLVRDGGALQRNLNEVLLGVLDALADSVRNLGSLTEAETNSTLAVAYNDQSCELEDSAALKALGNAVDRYNVLGELVLTLIVSVKLSHVLPPPD